MNIVPGEPFQARAVLEEVAPAAGGEPAPQGKRARRARKSLGRAISVALMIAMASGPAAVQAFREDGGDPADVLACEATVLALSREGSALDVMLTSWTEATDEAITSEAPRARAAMQAEDVDGFVGTINRVIGRCHNISGEFTDRFDAFCDTNPESCRDRFSLF